MHCLAALAYGRRLTLSRRKSHVTCSPPATGSLLVLTASCISKKHRLFTGLSPLSYKVFGVHDWAARLPVALSSIALAWLTAAFARWAFGKRAALYSGLVMATCVGLFLFTRIQIPDVMRPSR